MTAADSAKKAREAVEEEMPLADCAMEAKFAIAKSRMALEEIAQATTDEEIAEILPEYNKSISDFDELLTAVLEGGVIDGTTVVVVHDILIPKLRSASRKIPSQILA